MSEKIFLKLNFDFIVAEIRGVFRSVGVYVCACLCDPIGLHDKSVVLFYLIWVGFEIVAATVVAATVFLFCKCTILNDIRRHSDPKNICQIAGNRI